MSYKLQRKLENIVNKHCKEIPYEGTEINKSGIENNIEELIKGLLKGYGTYCLQNYTITEHGWMDKEFKNIHARENIVEDFLHKNL